MSKSTARLFQNAGGHYLDGSSDTFPFENYTYNVDGASGSLPSTIDLSASSRVAYAGAPRVLIQMEAA